MGFGARKEHHPPLVPVPCRLVGSHRIPPAHAQRKAPGRAGQGGRRVSAWEARRPGKPGAEPGGRRAEHWTRAGNPGPTPGPAGHVRGAQAGIRWGPADRECARRPQTFPGRAPTSTTLLLKGQWLFRSRARPVYLRARNAALPSKSTRHFLRRRSPRRTPLLRAAFISGPTQREAADQGGLCPRSSAALRGVLDASTLTCRWQASLRLGAQGGTHSMRAGSWAGKGRAAGRGWRMAMTG